MATILLNGVATDASSIPGSDLNDKLTVSGGVDGLSVDLAEGDEALGQGPPTQAALVTTSSLLLPTTALRTKPTSRIFSLVCLSASATACWVDLART